MFVIVRHGNTFEAGQSPRRVGARTDLPLTAAGLAQAQALGRLFAEREWHFDRVLVSPLLRTRQTAEAILSLQPAAAGLQIAEFLNEIDHGPDENMPEDSVIARVGHAAIAAWDAEGIVPTGWIANEDARIAAWRDLFAATGDGGSNTLLVTSNGAARFAFRADPTLRQGMHGLSLKLPTGGFGVIADDGLGQRRVIDWGSRP